MPILLRHKLAGQMTLLFVAAFIVLSAGCNQVRWTYDYQRGMTRAQAEGRRAVVQFYSSFNRDCFDMDRSTFADDEVRQLMRRFVPIRVEAWANRQLIERFEVQHLPAFFVIRPDITVAGSTSGQMDAEQFRIFLIKNSFN